MNAQIGARRVYAIGFGRSVHDNVLGAGRAFSEVEGRGRQSGLTLQRSWTFSPWGNREKR